MICRDIGNYNTDNDYFYLRWSSDEQWNFNLDKIK